MERQETQDLLNLKIPPNLIQNPNDSIDTEAFDVYDEQIKHLRNAILQEPEIRYAINLDSLTQDQRLYVAEVDLEDLNSDQLNQLQQYKSSYQQVKNTIKNRKQEIHDQEKIAKHRIKNYFKKKTKMMKNEEKEQKKGTNKRRKEIIDRFKQGKKLLNQILKQRKAHSRERIGKIQEQVEPQLKLWGKHPQKLFVRIELCRAVKDKLPCAYFVVVVTLYQRLGGTTIEISKENRITKPKRHGGRFTHNCLRFQQDLELIVPPLSKIRPSMVIAFEIFMLKNKTLRYDKPVGYGFFPLCNSDFGICEGRFKTPLLKGSLDKKIEKYIEFEQRYMNNLDSWLCNLYFQTNLTEPPTDVEQLKAPDQFEEFRFAVTGPDGLRTRWEGWKRLHYMMGEVFQDLGVRMGKFKSGNMWISLMILIFCLWISRLTHYFGQWVFLHMAQIAITEFEVFWGTFILKFASDLSFGYIVGILLFGTIFSLIFFLIFILVVWLLIRKGTCFLPSIVYKVGVMYGFCIFIDPFTTLVQSLALALGTDDWERDPFLLSIYFQEQQDSQFYGPIITMMVYLINIGMTVFTLYNYILYLHMGSRMLDTYNRLTAQESKFFVPYDSEVSEKYLAWVIRKAHSFKSMNGDIRKVAVAEYTERSTNEVNTHVAIYTVGKSKSIYRHFMRLPSGAISELSTTRFNIFAGDED